MLGQGKYFKKSSLSITPGTQLTSIFPISSVPSDRSSNFVVFSEHRNLERRAMGGLHQGTG